MARIRTIKPEFWQDEKLAPLPVIDRLVFLGLISQADDAGRLVDNPKLLDGLLFPMSSDSSSQSLDNLTRLGRIIRYRAVSGQQLIQIAKWADHQKVDKASKYNLPAPTVADLAPAEHSNGNGHSAQESRGNVAGVSRKSRAPIPDLLPSTPDLLPPSVDKSTGDKSPQNFQSPTSDEPPEPTTFAEFMALLRLLNYEADDTDASIAKVWFKKLTIPDVLPAVYGLPILVKQGKYRIAAGQKLNLRMLYSSEKGRKMPAWTRAEDAYLKSENGRKPVALGAL